MPRGVRNYEPNPDTGTISHIIASDADINDIREDIQVVHQKADGPEFKAKADMLKFMEEPVTVYVHRTTDRNADVIVEVGVNGRTQRFVRGMDITVKRKFVEALARSKPEEITTSEFVNPMSGDHDVRMDIMSGLKYPFEIRHDANPNGRAWLDKILADPA